MRVVKQTRDNNLVLGVCLTGGNSVMIAKEDSDKIIFKNITKGRYPHLWRGYVENIFSGKSALTLQTSMPFQGYFSLKTDGGRGKIERENRAERLFARVALHNRPRYNTCANRTGPIHSLTHTCGKIASLPTGRLSCGKVYPFMGSLHTFQ